MARAYYNEIDPFCAQWLRNLIAGNHIVPGDVDTRSIEDVRPDELRDYDQCHFFAGIGGWSLALRLAGWPDDRPVWTGSCPCQPFTRAGKRRGVEDVRHLWPTWQRLIQQRHPPALFGEQTADSGGREWFDSVYADLEREGYAVGGVNICAAGVGAPHIRGRLYFAAGRLADSEFKGLEGYINPAEQGTGCAVRRIAVPGHAGAIGAYAWAEPLWAECHDGTARPFESGSCPLAYGISNRMGSLHAYGNAIVPQVGAEVVAAYMACLP